MQGMVWCIANGRVKRLRFYPLGGVGWSTRCSLVGGFSKSWLNKEGMALGLGFDMMDLISGQLFISFTIQLIAQCCFVPFRFVVIVFWHLP